MAAADDIFSSAFDSCGEADIWSSSQPLWESGNGVRFKGDTYGYQTNTGEYFGPFFLLDITESVESYLNFVRLQLLDEVSQNIIKLADALTKQ